MTQYFQHSAVMLCDKGDHTIEGESSPFSALRHLTLFVDTVYLLDFTVGARRQDLYQTGFIGSSSLFGRQNNDNLIASSSRFVAAKILLSLFLMQFFTAFYNNMHLQQGTFLIIRGKQILSECKTT